MCGQCGEVRRLFEWAQRAPQENYRTLICRLGAMEEAGDAELYAGDCLLKDAPAVLESEQHFTVCHYFRCGSCGTFYFAGACIRGAPVYRITPSLKPEEIEKRIWGHTGAYYG